MTNEPKFTTYHSINAQPHEAWIAYINGWKVRCVGSTEQEAKDRALKLWNGERERMTGQAEIADVKTHNNVTWGSDIHGNVGKVWMRHPEHGLKRVIKTEVAALGEGWYKSGPRGK